MCVILCLTSLTRHYFVKFIQVVVCNCNLFFVIFWLHLGLLCCAQAFLYLQRARATLRCGAKASWALGVRASVVVAFGLSSSGSLALELRLSSCGTWASLLCGMWDLPGPGLEPMSPALTGGFLTTAPPEKPSSFHCYVLSQ